MSYCNYCVIEYRNNQKTCSKCGLEFNELKADTKAVIDSLSDESKLYLRELLGIEYHFFKKDIVDKIPKELFKKGVLTEIEASQKKIIENIYEFKQEIITSNSEFINIHKKINKEILKKLKERYKKHLINNYKIIHSLPLYKYLNQKINEKNKLVIVKKMPAAPLFPLSSFEKNIKIIIKNMPEFAHNLTKDYSVLKLNDIFTNDFFPAAAYNNEKLSHLSVDFLRENKPACCLFRLNGKCTPLQQCYCSKKGCISGRHESKMEKIPCTEPQQLNLSLF